MKKNKTAKRGYDGKPTVIEFNLSKAVLVAIAIGVIIIAITTAKMVSTLTEEGQEESSLMYEIMEDDEGNQVPIPDGYVASEIPGETSVNTGFVIYEETEEGIDWGEILVEDETEREQNIYDLQRSTNQWVWVPVDDVTRICGVDSNGKLWGKLYEYSDTDRSALNWTLGNASSLISITDATGYREPDVITDYNTDYDIDSALQSYLDGTAQYELLSKELERSFYLMIQSIENVGGFYIGRYETGGLSETAVVQKMNTDIASQTWYTMYEKCKELSGDNDNVITSMIWGCLWDETLQWFIDSKATTSNGETLTYELVGSDSTGWGNYGNATFDYISSGSETPWVTEIKEECTVIPAGSAEYTNVNNIYDLAGNVYEITLESSDTWGRSGRSGYHNLDGDEFPASARGYLYPNYKLDELRLSCHTFSKISIIQ